MRSSRAYRIASSVLFRLLYGLPGSIHKPEKPRSSLMVACAVDVHSATTVTPSCAAECVHAAYVAGCGGNSRSYSPISAMRVSLVTMIGPRWNLKAAPGAVVELAGDHQSHGWAFNGQ